MKKYIYLALLITTVSATACNNSSSSTNNTADTTHVHDSLPLHDSTDASNPDAPSEPH